MNKLSVRHLLLVSSLPLLNYLTTVASAQELKDAAAAKSVLFGSVLYNLEVPANVNLLINNSSVGTVPAYWKYTTHIVEGPITFAETDRAIELAESNAMEVHGHPLVWGDDYHIPDWVLEKPLQDAEAIMLDHIRQVAGRYRGRVDTWDVVNEAIEYDGSYRDSYWHRAMSEEYIFKAFSEAHAVAPDATLLYNDYKMESNESKFRTIKNLLSQMQSSNVKVDGLGWQLHVWADDVFKPEFKLEEYMAQISMMGLDNYVTELDVRIPNNSDPELIKQKQAYKIITEIFLRNATRGKYFQTWGLSDEHTWLDINNNEYDSSNIVDHPLPFDRNYTKKPAYWGLYEAFTNNDSPNLHHADLNHADLNHPDLHHSDLHYEGELRIKNLWTNTYLNENGDSPGSNVTLHPTRPDWYSQRWNIEPGPNGTYRFKSSWGGNYLNNSADVNGAPVNVLTYEADYSSEMWFIEPTENGLFRIKNRWTNTYLHASDQYDVSTHEYNSEWSSQLWVFEYLTSPR